MSKFELPQNPKFETYSCKFYEVSPPGFENKILAQVLKEIYPTLDDMVYLKNDFELTQSLSTTGTLKSYEMVRTNTGFVIYKEYFDGIPLEKYLLNKEFSVPLFLQLAIRLTSLLKELHNKKIIVKEFTLENILISPETHELKICSLGSATKLTRERPEFSSEFNYYGPLWHIAPEQTGRIGRTVDYRADYYSLGVIFYQLLCWRKPFNYTDSLELIHAHIAKNPVEPKTIKQNLPAPVNDVVMKLMSKNAEDRYQSEEGIVEDLEQCIRKWQLNGTIDSFALGMKDHSSIFTLSEKMYGRKNELNQLLNTWEHIKQNPIELFLVTGYSGIGKTRLINEIRKPVLECNAYFINGKFDQFNRENPYSAFGIAFNELLSQMLSEQDEQIQIWKQAIEQTLGENASLLIGVIPELEKLIGTQAKVYEIGPVEGKKRFFNAFIQFLAILDHAEKPLVIFVDDLQWADSGSLDLISAIMNSQLKNILLIGAFRDNEVDESHPLIMTIHALKKEISNRIHTLKLSPITAKDVNDLIADSLHLNVKNTQGLSDLVMTKTRGNPFFVKQFMEKLVDEKRIYFDRDILSWMWDLKSINSLELTDYVVDLILSKLKKLSGPAQEAISLAACIGNTFDLETLAIISERSENELADLLWENVNADFINPIGKWVKYHQDVLWNEMILTEKSNTNFPFRFQHDRIQQAAYAMIEEKDRNATHLKIGRTLLTKMSNEEFEENLFDVLNHINAGRELIISATEKKELASLNLRAAKKAFRNNAIRPALNHFAIGMDLIDQDKDPEIFKDLLIGRSESEYILGNFKASEDLFNQALINSNSKINKADILCRKMALYENTQRHEKALEAAQQGLKLLGIHLPLNANALHVMKELLTVKFLLRNKSTSDLLNNKNMESPEKILVMKILMNLWGPVYLLQKQNLLAFKILRMVNLSIRYGNSIESALAYAFYGYVISAQLKDYTAGYEFAKLGMALNDKFKDKSLRSKVLVISEGCVAHWKLPFHSYLQNLREAHHVGVESNDIIYAGYAVTFVNRSQFIMGDDLNRVYEKLLGYIQFANKIHSIISLHQMMPWARVIVDLLDITPTEMVFGEFLKESDQLNYIEKLTVDNKLYLPLVNYCIAKSIYNYILADYESSHKYSEKAEPILASVLGLPEWGEHFVFTTLSTLALQLNGTQIDNKQLKRFKNAFALLKLWAKESPSNYESKYLLALAEQYLLNNKISEARSFYIQALKSSQNAEMKYMSAAIYERMAFMNFRLKETEQAERNLHLALIEYQQWGAKKKVNALLKKFTFLESTSSSKESSKKGISSSSLDLQSVLRAASSLSGEVVLEKLLEKLLLIVIENAGAQNGYLFRIRNNKIYLDANSKLINGNTCEIKSYPIEDVKSVSRAIVRKVNNTKETVIVDDVKLDLLYAGDHDLQALTSKSVLCMPILSKGQMTAILYLDNDVSTHVFTRNRLEILNLLSGQMAVSIENAQLYQNLEQKVIERTSTIEKQKIELEQEKHKTDSLLLNILPEEIAEELKSNGNSKPRRHESVTIMFTDFEKFTMMSEKLTPEEIVEIVDHHYKAFDQIIEKHNIEKIKTMGDAYMCVSGLPRFNEEHAVNAIKAALEIRQFVKTYNAYRDENGLPFCNIRIGIHTGPVVAGVVGLNKFAYDIWGDSVNTASRMQSVSEPGKINISNTTFELIKNRFECLHRGKIKVKYKADIDMYFINTPDEII
ncbi:MAG: AAA family ATPase [Saprospiraceae bacterium]|nr:AAA family ATPase [Saprospiraceae bacterium]